MVMILSLQPSPTRETSARLVYRKEKITLLRYAPDKPKIHPVPVFIVTPLIARPYILDLSPDLSFVTYLTNEGFDVFMMDFGVAHASDRYLKFDNYIYDYMAPAMDYALSLCGSPSASLLGYCLGGIFATLYTALIPEPVRNLVILAAPINFSQGGPLYRWLQGLDVDRLVDSLGNIPPEFIRDNIRLFASMMAPERNLRAVLDLLLHLWDWEYLRRQQRIHQWLQDLLPFPGEAYRQFIKELVQANKLVRKELYLRGRLVNLSRITCPILIMAHRADLLAPPESVKDLVNLVASEDKEFFEVAGGSVGHLDIVVGREGPRVTWPKISSWLKGRSR